MRIPRWLVPWRKMTDMNTVTPIRDIRSGSRFGWIFESFGGAWQRDIVVAQSDSLLAIAAVSRCINLISDDIGKLRIKLVEFNEGIWQERMDPSPSFQPVLRKPNRYQTRIQFLQQWMVSKLMYGNTYVYKERDGKGNVVALYILDPNKVSPLITQDGDVYYRCNSDNLTQTPFGYGALHRSEIIHDRAFCPFHPLCGVPPLYSIARTGTQALKMQANAERFFANMSRPSGQLTSPTTINPETAKRLKEQFETNFGGANIGRLLVSGDGLKYEPMTMPFEQSQFIEQMGFTVEDIARGFGVPLYKLSAGKNPTFTNVGAMNQDYYSQTLQIHIEAIELLLDEGLALPMDRGIELDLAALLRMDQEALSKFVDTGIKGAFITPNEGRAMFNLPPKTGGNELYLQQQNFSLPALMKRDAADNPFSTGSPPPANPQSQPAAAAADDPAAGKALLAAEAALQKAIELHAEAVAKQEAAAEAQRIAEASRIELERNAKEAADAAIAKAQAECDKALAIIERELADV